MEPSKTLLLTVIALPPLVGQDGDQVDAMADRVGEDSVDPGEVELSTWARCIATLEDLEAKD